MNWAARAALALVVVAIVSCGSTGSDPSHGSGSLASGEPGGADIQDRFAVQPTGGLSTDGQLTGGLSTGGFSTGGLATGGLSTGGQLISTGGLATGGQPTGGQPTGGQPTGGLSTGGLSTGGLSTGGLATGGQPTGGLSTGGLATGGLATGGLATGGLSTGGSGIEVPPSCAQGLECADGIGCCDSQLIPGGDFLMGRGFSADACPLGETCEADEQPEHMVSVSSFRLDTFEVTVGRFREFFWFYPENLPAPGDGENPSFPGSGWRAEWSASMPSRSAAIASFLCHEEATWNKQENLPINCVSWSLAFAFCAWDGGRLPTETEWEFAAAGGDENRLYPWGSNPPDLLANYFSDAPAEVGSFPDGNNRWGISDLSGNVGEWSVDLYDPGWYSIGCSGCPNLDQGFERVVRGGNWWSGSNDLRAASRWYLNPSGTGGGSGTGFRCARSI